MYKGIERRSVKTKNVFNGILPFVLSGMDSYHAVFKLLIIKSKLK
jgi:hypothetical protein